jgi:AraC-like DNA-binding protein
MYTESISFDNKTPVRMNVYTIREYPLHCHENAIEIIFVLKGTVRVKASFEYFTLEQGDYVVVNREDSHKIWQDSESDNLVAVFHINLAYYRAYFPYIYYVLFCCESFDLAKYKGQANQLRQILLKLLESLVHKGRKGGETTKDITARLMDLLVNEYSMERYYNRNKDISTDKLNKYYKVMKYIYEHYYDKNLLQHIARNEFYSKSYISHLFKDVGAASFQDVLGYIRVFKAERMLLETDSSITTISDQCGFSDLKYFNRIFKKWFLIKPSDYRKNYQNEIGRDIQTTKATTEKILASSKQLRNLSDDSSEYKVSMTPLTLKNIGSKTDLLNYQDQNLALTEIAASRKQAGCTYAIIRIDNNSNADDIEKLLEQHLRDFQHKVARDIDFWFMK